jgi:Flp pilus assembly protein TadG
MGRAREVIGQFFNLLQDRTGAIAVEFALILPIMIAVYLGTVEMSSGFAAYRQMSLVTSTAATLVAKQSSIQHRKCPII